MDGEKYFELEGFYSPICSWIIYKKEEQFLEINDINNNMDVVSLSHCLRSIEKIRKPFYMTQFSCTCREWIQKK